MTRALAFVLLVVMVFHLERGMAEAQEAVWLPVDGVASVVSTDRVVRARRIHDGNLTLHHDEIALLPVRRGASVRVRAIQARDVRTGLAYGDRPQEAAILWDPERAADHEVWVAPHDGAQWVALSFKGHARIESTSVTHEPLAHHRFREGLLRWLRGRDAPPTPHTYAEERILRLAEEVRRVFGPAVDEELRLWILRQAEVIAAPEETLRSPYFTGSSLSVSSTATVVPSGKDLSVSPGNSTHIKMWIRARRGRPARARVLLDGHLVGVLRWTGRQASDRAGWSRVAVFRKMAIHAGQVVTVEVEAGEVSVRALGYRRVRTLDGYLREFYRRPAHRGRRGTYPALRHVDALYGGGDPVRREAEEWVEKGSGPSPHRAFVLVALALTSSVESEVVRHVTAAWPLLRGYPSLRARLAERLFAIRAALPPSLCEVPPVAAGPDELLGSALVRSLCPTTFRGRPVAADALVRLARSRRASSHLVRLAARVWRREGRWRRSEPSESASVSTFEAAYDGARDGTCRSLGRHGRRWTVLAPGKTELPLAKRWHASFRVENPENDFEGTITVGSHSVAVHGALGLESRLWLDPGDHVIEIPDDAPPILVRWPHDRRLPCEQLRDRVRFAPFLGSVHLPVPGAGAPTRALVDLRARPGEQLPSRLEVRSTEGMRAIQLLSPRTATFEIPVGASVDRVDLEGDGGSGMIRFRYRSDRYRPVPLPKELLERDLADEDAALRRVRALSDRLRSEPAGEARLGLLRDRAMALLALGYRRYAVRDWVAGGWDEEVLEALVSRVRRPAGTADRFARLEPFVGFDREEAAVLRRALGDGHRSEVIGRTSEKDDGLMALARALAAEGDGDALTAADAWERVGDPTADGEAAALWEGIARTTRDPKAWLRAFALASAADPDQLEEQRRLVRLRGAVDWVRPASPETTAGTVLQVIHPDDSGERRLGAAVRAALLGSPTGGMILRDGEFSRVSLRFAEEGVVGIDARCAKEDDGSPCSMTVRLDGNTVGEFTEGPFALRVSAGSHRLEVEPGVRAMAWVKLDTPEETPLPERVRRWFVATDERPVEHAILGPTVGRLELLGSPGTKVRLSVDGQVREVLTLTEADTKEVLVGVRDAGVHRVSVHGVGGRVWVRTLVAAAVDLPPLPPDLLSDPDPDAPPPPGSAMVASLDERVPRDPIDPGPLSVLTHLRVVGVDVRDLDAGASGAPYGELGVTALRAFGRRPFLISGGGLLRTRSGPPSYGARLRLESPAWGALPRLIARGEVMTQELVGRSFVGYSARATGVWTIGLGPVFSLHPVLTANFDQVDRVPAGVLHVDPDVYTLYYEDRPFGLAASLVGYTRPMVDVTARIRARILTNPDVETIDRVEWGTSVDVVTGSGNAPWLSFSYLASYRFASSLRSDAFLRHGFGVDATFWQWGRGIYRGALSMNTRWLPDIDLVEWGVQIDLLWAPHRGVADLDRSETENVDRMNEGALLAEELRRRTSGLREDADVD
ncbi:MAG: hypothetical protein KC416_02405 [Myxococcales bacterium]|nr:hypothetical protein [Myxococcales bacterium]